MARPHPVIQWLQAWLLPALALVLLATVLTVAARRWQQLHGTIAAATIHQKLGKAGSGSSSHYQLLARYQHRQGNKLYARLTTSRGTYDDLLVGERIQIGYADDAGKALLASEWSVDGHLLLLLLVGLLILSNGLSAHRTWRNRRRNGYLPN